MSDKLMTFYFFKLRLEGRGFQKKKVIKERDGRG